MTEPTNTQASEVEGASEKPKSNVRRSVSKSVPLSRHIVIVWQTAIWRTLARIHIGDPLNALVHVNKYRPYRRTVK